MLLMLVQLQGFVMIVPDVSLLSRENMVVILFVARANRLSIHVFRNTKNAERFKMFHLLFKQFLLVKSLKYTTIMLYCCILRGASMATIQVLFPTALYRVLPI